MTDLARFLIELLQTLWPLRQVDQWESGVRFWLGRTVGIVGPGFYWVIPYFGDVKPVSVVPAVLSTPLLTITLVDGKTCTYSLSAVLKVVDAELALCAVDDYTETSQELLTSIPAAALAEVAAERLEPDSRGRLIAALRKQVNTELKEYGLEVSSLRFTNFALNLKTIRLLSGAGEVTNW